MTVRILLAVVLALAATCAGPAAAAGRAGSAPSAPPPPTLPPTEDVAPALSGALPPATGKSAEITGFRSARFGMNESGVRQAIRSDFGSAVNTVVVTKDDLEKTTALQIGVDELLPVAGKGKVSYVFGAQSKALIEVNVAWGAAAGVETSPEALIEAADLLRTHFMAAPFRPEDLLLNWQLPDGSTVVLRGLDRHHHAVLLVLAGEKQSAPTDVEGAVPILRVTTLMLSYIQDLRHFDGFHLKREAF
jgi:hypothetical protein